MKPPELRPSLKVGRVLAEAQRLSIDSTTDSQTRREVQAALVYLRRAERFQKQADARAAKGKRRA